jgi:hypothetical protein
MNPSLTAYKRWRRAASDAFNGLPIFRIHLLRI